MLINTKRVRLTRRDAFLGVFGIVYILLGYSWLNIPAEFKPLIHAQLRFAINIVPIEGYAWAWIAAGVLCILGAAFRRFHAIGFGAGVYVALFWSFAYWIAWFGDGVPRSWVAAMLYALIGLSLWLVSGMKEHPDNAVFGRRQ